MVSVSSLPKNHQSRNTGLPLEPFGPSYINTTTKLVTNHLDIWGSLHSLCCGCIIVAWRLYSTAWTRRSLPAPTRSNDSKLPFHNTLNTLTRLSETLRAEGRCRPVVRVADMLVPRLRRSPFTGGNPRPHKAALLKTWRLVRNLEHPAQTFLATKDSNLKRYSAKLFGTAAARWVIGRTYQLFHTLWKRAAEVKLPKRRWAHDRYRDFRIKNKWSGPENPKPEKKRRDKIENQSSVGPSRWRETFHHSVNVRGEELKPKWVSERNRRCSRNAVYGQYEAGTQDFQVDERQEETLAAENLQRFTFIHSFIHTSSSSSSSLEWQQAEVTSSFSSMLCNFHPRAKQLSVCLSVCQYLQTVPDQTCSRASVIRPPPSANWVLNAATGWASDSQRLPFQPVDGTVHTKSSQVAVSRPSYLELRLRAVPSVAASDLLSRWVQSWLPGPAGVRTKHGFQTGWPCETNTFIRAKFKITKTNKGLCSCRFLLLGRPRFKFPADATKASLHHRLIDGWWFSIRRPLVVG